MTPALLVKCLHNYDFQNKLQKYLGKIFFEKIYLYLRFYFSI